MSNTFISQYPEVIAIIIGALFSLIMILLTFILKQVFTRIKAMETVLQTLPADHNNLQNTVVKLGHAITAQEEVIEDTRQESNNIRNNYLDRFRDLEIKILKDNSATRHALNDGLQKIIGIISLEREKTGERFVTQDFCTAHHDQSNAEVKHLQADIARVAKQVEKIETQLFKKD